MRKLSISSQKQSPLSIHSWNYVICIKFIISAFMASFFIFFSSLMQILTALEIVRQDADVMPRSQLNDVLDAELGPDWSSKLRSFDYEPLAAASIGQVISFPCHLKSTM